jgi:hypothetical protein
MNPDTKQPMANILELIQQNEQQFIEGNVITKRLTKIMYSREVLVVYIDRRVIQYSVASGPFNLLRLPTSAAGMEKVTTKEICKAIEPSFKLEDDDYILASAIVLDTGDLKVIDQNANDKVSYVKGSYAVIKNGLFTPPTVSTTTPTLTRSVSGDDGTGLGANKYQIGGANEWKQYKPYADAGEKLDKIYKDLNEDTLLTKLNTNANVLIYYCKKNNGSLGQLVF